MAKPRANLRDSLLIEAGSQCRKIEAEAQCRKYWLAAYTRSRHERQVAEQLRMKNLEFLLPSYNKMRRFEIPQGTGRL